MHRIQEIGDGKNIAVALALGGNFQWMRAH